jgi:hypothetical protein
MSRLCMSQVHEPMWGFFLLGPMSIIALRCPIHPRGFNDGFKGRVSVVWTRGLDVCWVEGCYSTSFSSL